jgi:type I restriction-modification system DNA methylase subunit
MTPRRTGPPSASELHRRWLQLVDTDGPFLSIPVLKRVWPQGMPALDGDRHAAVMAAKPAFEQAWDAWDSHHDPARPDQAAANVYAAARDVWVDLLLRDVVGWADFYTTDLASLPIAAPVATSPDRQVSVRPTGAVVHGDPIGALVMVVPPSDSLRDIIDDGWAASGIDRMEAVLRAAGVPVGLVTDGRWWGLVCARDGEMAASGIVDAQTWAEEREVRDAFLTLLHLQRLVGGKPEDRLPALFAESVAAAEEITEALGVQVRRAVELLVSAFSEAAEDARGRGEPDPLPADRGQVYEAAVTIMMRVVFLLFAEERSLLPQGELFTLGYGLSGELDALDRRAREENSEALDGTHLTWHRLLATSQALYAGASFEDIRLPSYGGSLFHPGRFPFLLQRQESGPLRIAVSDRVMLEVLRAVQVAELRGQPARRISFRDIDVEQIGYIYEGLLGYTCVDVDQITLGLIGSAGAEPEITLAELESITGRYADPTRTAEAIIAHVQASQPASRPPTKAALAKAYRSSEEVEDAERALLAVTRGDALRTRLRPVVGMIRRDLRDRPVVVQPGGLLVVETPSRATAGAHYTPRSLAEEVVEHAIEPLVFSPGPHQTADRDRWRRISSDAILDLKVADIACGSGAFLVAAARYLAARLVEAWRVEGAAIGEPHALYLSAVRKVVASCLYGADINAMAVEMCKLSLWLVSLDPKLPFSFVDDKVLHGNSLLGLTDVGQLKAMHIDPDKISNAPSLFDLDVEAILRRAANLRRRLATEVDDLDPQRSAITKRRQLRELQETVAPLALVADGVIAAGLALGGKPGKTLDSAYENLRIAVADAFPSEGDGDRVWLDKIIADGLTPTMPTDYERWQPLHWILAVPDVLERGGFDAVIGNPPFLGGKKISGATGSNVREWFVNVLAGEAKGNADLVAYFFLRAWSLLTGKGNLGFIATNTVAQGDTREVGLDRMVADGFSITRSIQSRPWPAASVNLEFAAAWGSRGSVADQVPRVSDDITVARISPLLEPAGRTEGAPIRLVENAGIAFIGCYVLGMGFVVAPSQAQSWIEEEPTNREVLFPFLNGEDLNSRPDCSGSRWVIDFGLRTELAAREFHLPFDRVLQLVKRERSRKAAAVREAPWWLYWRTRPAMRKAIADLDEVLVISLVSKSVMPMRVPTGQVFSHRLGVFATNSYVDQATLSSMVHWLWAVTYSSTLESRVNYAPSDVFLTFPRPVLTDWLDKTGRRLDTERRETMLRRDLGLTKLYNLINDPDIADESDKDVAKLRAIHVELDRAVMDAYGWSDVDLGHGFHTYRQMQRWTVSPAARIEILDRLLEENHRRAAAQGTAPAPSEDNEEAEA